MPVQHGPEMLKCFLLLYFGFLCVIPRTFYTKQVLLFVFTAVLTQHFLLILIFHPARICTVDLTLFYLLLLLMSKKRSVNLRKSAQQIKNNAPIYVIIIHSPLSVNSHCVLEVSCVP